MIKQGYINKDSRKKILLLSDDLRMTSGVATMTREIVLGSAHKFNWVQIAGGINHPEKGKRLDLSQDTNKILEIEDSSVIMYPTDGYGTPELVRQIIEIERPDAIMLFTDPRYFVWLFDMEAEIRKRMPIIYLQIWDSDPAPIYNKSYYESCDAFMCISKQTKILTELVLEEKIKDKIINYVPHGINEKTFFPINEFMIEANSEMEKMKKGIFGSFNPEFIVLYNARNIRRKSTSDLIAAWSKFTESIGKEKASKCALLLHTQKTDEHGTDLPKVVELLCDPSYQKVYFSEERYTPEQMNLLYNLADVTALISSNEGWGLSLTESMMSGTMIIGNVTGGMQDQMRFVKDGKWYEPTKEMPSNHFGTLRECGEWAIPVFPSNLSLVGSIPTPYIFDDRCDFRDVADAINKVYSMTSEERQKRGLSGRKWVTSSESKMSAQSMADGVCNTLQTAIDKFKPRASFEFIKIEDIKPKKIKHPLTY
jgi:glycosyltransferase involved in cell wall biosynthesis